MYLPKETESLLLKHNQCWNVFVCLGVWTEAQLSHRRKDDTRIHFTQARVSWVNSVVVLRVFKKQKHSLLRIFFFLLYFILKSLSFCVNNPMYCDLNDRASSGKDSNQSEIAAFRVALSTFLQHIYFHSQFTAVDLTHKHTQSQWDPDWGRLQACVALFSHAESFQFYWFLFFQGRAQQSQHGAGGAACSGSGSSSYSLFLAGTLNVWLRVVDGRIDSPQLSHRLSQPSHFFFFLSSFLSRMLPSCCKPPIVISANWRCRQSCREKSKLDFW